MDPDDEEDVRSRRQLQRANQRDVGERSAKLASTLMKLSEADLEKLELDEEVADAVATARAITSQQARRRAERQLAGDLRRLDLDEAERQVAKLADSAVREARRFKDAEQWRTRLIAEGSGALAAFPGGGDDKLRHLIENAHKEKATGRPPGAAKALFRHIVELLKKAG